MHRRASPFGPREVEQIAEDAADPLGLPLHPREEVALLLRRHPPLQEQVLHPEDRRERVSDLVREPGGEAPHARHLLAPNELALRLGETRGRLRELLDLRAEDVGLEDAAIGHRAEARAELRELPRRRVRDGEEA